MQLIGTTLVMLALLVFFGMIHYTVIVQYNPENLLPVVGLVVLDLFLVGSVLIAAGGDRP